MERLSAYGAHSIQHREKREIESREARDEAARRLARQFGTAPERSTHGTILVERDEAGQRCHQRARAADVHAHEQRLVAVCKMRQQHGGGDVADDLAGTGGHEQGALAHPEREEALLFAQQTGISERLSAGQKLRALIFAGEPAAVAFQQATELAGVHLSFEEGRGKQRISCIATAYHEFIRLGPELYIESLDVLLNAWDGEPDSMSSANLLGICRFVELYHSEYSKSRLIAKLRQVDAFTIFRLARTAGVSLPGKTKYLQQVYTIYNGGSRRAALPLKF